MKKLLVLLVSIVVSLTACNVDGDAKFSRTGFHLGTVVSITIYGGRGEDSLDAAFEEIIRLESILSKNIKGSDIYKINSNAGKEKVEIQPETMLVLAESLKYNEKSNGYFDITIGPLVDLWNIGTEEAVVPTPDEIENALVLIDINKLDFTNDMIGLKEPLMSIDTGGIAKGFIADRISEILVNEGCSGALINLGGNVLTIGQKPDGSKWKIGIQDPFMQTGNYMEIVEINEMSVVTSGPYERNFVENGILYHHILDPFTGYPIDNNIAGVTIISEKSIDGDGLSTSVFAMGADDGLVLIEETDNTECYIVLNDGTIIMSSGFSDYL
ncbi:MAG: FAD:protein FMN transferase [Clostridiales bacterium]|nr:FAD:protein FMN transferase [Clostridiales bacterium]